MPIDPSIPLAYKPPDIHTPLQTIGAMMQMRDAASQIALRQAQTQQAQQQQQLIQAEAAQKNRDLTDQNAAQEWLKDPKNAYAFGKGDLSGLLGKVQTKSYQALQKTALEAQEQHLALGEKTLALNGQKLAGIQTGLDGLTTLPDDGARAAAWPELKQQWQKLGYLDEIPPDAIPPAISGKPEEIQAMAAKLNVARGLTDAALARGKAKAEIPHIESETAAQQAAAAAHLAGIPAATAEGAIKTGQAAHISPEGLLPEEQVRAQEAKARILHEQNQLAETQRHNLSEESISRLTNAVAQGRLQIEQMVNGMKYGPGTQQYWVQQLQQNPDSIAEMPAELRSVVGKGFTAATGLPLPTKVGEAAKTQETAARNALDGAQFIEKALQNPEIRANLGPIMGRLGLAEQTLGSAPQLSPEASALAQELRTRMRYFVFQEGKAILGGRLPQQLMKELESSSANPRMDTAMLEGAIRGAVDNAQSVMENVDKQRFGGKARSATVRGAVPTAVSVPEINSQAEYDKLPKGAHYTNNGVPHIKQ